MLDRETIFSVSSLPQQGHFVRFFGQIDCMVNNAGVTHRNGPLTEVGEAEFDRIFAVNVKAIYHSAIHCVPQFRRLGGGNFINIASTAGLRGRAGPGSRRTRGLRDRRDLHAGRRADAGLRPGRGDAATAGW